jgi:hypothetical protein
VRHFSRSGKEENLHKKSIDNFIAACLGSESLLVTAKQGAYVQTVIEKLYASAEQHIPIIL